MKFAAFLAQLGLGLYISLPALADFKLDIPPELSASTQDFDALVTEVKMIERDVNDMLEFFVHVFTEYNTNPLHQEALYNNFGRDLGTKDVKELEMMTKKVQGSTITVKNLYIQTPDNQMSTSDIGQPSSNGQTPLGATLTRGSVYAINRAAKAIAFYPAFFDPIRAPPRRAGLVIAAAFKIICDAQDTFMKNKFGRWHPVPRSQTIGKDKVDVIDTLTDDGFLRLGSEAYWATIHDAEAFKWLALEFHGISRYRAEGGQNSTVKR